MSLGINVFRNKCRRKNSRGNICHLGINIAQSVSQSGKLFQMVHKLNIRVFLAAKKP